MIKKPSKQSKPSRPTKTSRKVGKYTIISKIAQGGMGAVYKALHTKLDKVVALKVLPAERMQHRRAVARFEREMKAVGKLDHPNIVRAADADEQDGVHYLVMEYIHGCDLSQLARRYGPLPVADACELVRQAAMGLQHAHELGLVHRDIKPSNLMLEWRKAGDRKLEEHAQGETAARSLPHAHCTAVVASTSWAPAHIPTAPTATDFFEEEHQKQTVVAAVETVVRG